MKTYICWSCYRTVSPGVKPCYHVIPRLSNLLLLLHGNKLLTSEARLSCATELQVQHHPVDTPELQLLFAVLAPPVLVQLHVTVVDGVHAPKLAQPVTLDVRCSEASLLQQYLRTLIHVFTPLTWKYAEAVRALKKFLAWEHLVQTEVLFMIVWEFALFSLNFLHWVLVRVESRFVAHADEKAKVWVVSAYKRFEVLRLWIVVNYLWLVLFE